MLLVSLTFVYIIFTTVNFGACVNSLFKTRTSDFATSSMLGMFAIALLASVWAIFYRVNWEFHVLLAMLNVALFFVFKNAIIAQYRLLRIEFSKLPKSLKLLFAANAVLILAKSAAAPYILDNESYYIQTVKWLNEFGFVKGLANLHVFLAQISGWHIAQSAFSFSFLYPNFNDLSGYCLLVANLFAVFRLNAFFKTRDLVSLALGLLPVANVFLLQFSGAPAADVPIVVLTLMAIESFVCYFRSPGRSQFTLLSMLVLFALYIKVTAVALAILPVVLLLKDFRLVMSKRLFFVGLSVLALFVTRNIFASGMPFFPLPYTFGLKVAHAIPQNVANFFFVESRPYPFGLTNAEFDAMPFWQIFLHWMRMPKLHGFFNTSGVILTLVAPFFLLKYANSKPMWCVYLTMVAQLFLLLWLSPQYRFFVNFILFFGFFCAACLVRNRVAITAILWTSAFAAAIPVFVPLRLDAVTDNKYANHTTALTLSELVFPHANSKSDTAFEKIKIGNLEYYSPVNNDFFWKTGDGGLPCVNKDQIHFFKTYFGLVPQLAGHDLSDGFIAEETNATSD